MGLWSVDGTGGTGELEDCGMWNVPMWSGPDCTDYLS
jgi:hypothetical protein